MNIEDVKVMKVYTCKNSKYEHFIFIAENLQQIYQLYEETLELGCPNSNRPGPLWSIQVILDSKFPELFLEEKSNTKKPLLNFEEFSRNWEEITNLLVLGKSPNFLGGGII